MGDGGIVASSGALAWRSEQVLCQHVGIIEVGRVHSGATVRSSVSSRWVLGLQLLRAASRLALASSAAARSSSARTYSTTS